MGWRSKQRKERHEPRGTEEEKNGDLSHTPYRDRRVQGQALHAAPTSECGSYLLSQPPSLIVGPGLLDAAPQVGALRVELPC